MNQMRAGCNNSKQIQTQHLFYWLLTNGSILNRELTLAHIELRPRGYSSQRVLALAWSKALFAF